MERNKILVAPTSNCGIRGFCLILGLVFIWLASESNMLKKVDTAVIHINLFQAMLALYVIGFQITICTDWSWIPMNEEDYKLPYQDKWSVNQQ